MDSYPIIRRGRRVEWPHDKRARDWRAMAPAVIIPLRTVMVSSSGRDGNSPSDFVNNAHIVTLSARRSRSNAPSRGTEVVNNIYLYDVALTYDFNHRFNVTAAIPFMKATRRRGTSPQIFHSFGFGDLVVMGRMWLFKQPSESPRNISFGVGIKFPTGKSNVTDTVLAGNGRTVTQVVDPKTTTPLSANFCCSFCIRGITAVHGTHHALTPGKTGTLSH